jgi:hypothetical protein
VATGIFSLPHAVLAGNVANPNHNRAVIRQSGFTAAMIARADWGGRCDECAIAKSVVDPKAIAFRGVPGPLVLSRHSVSRMVSGSS